MRPLHPTMSATDVPGATRPDRILLIAYHFPPSTVVGALRWDRLARLLVARGYAVDVITLEPSQTPRIDEKRLASLPRGIRVFAVEQKQPLALVAWNWLAQRTKRLRSTRATTARASGVHPESTAKTAPAPVHHNASPSLVRRLRMSINARLHVAEELDWARRAAAAAQSLGRQATYHAVVTSGPPHYAHYAGYLVSQRCGIPHIPDFRDPWRLAESANPDHDLAFLARSDVAHESRVVANAAAIVMNTEAAASAMRATYPSRSHDIVAIMNGSDPEDRIASPQRDRFTLLYAGSLYLQRDPRVLFRASASLVRDLGLTPAQFAIQFLGPVDQYAGQAVPDLAEPYGLRDHVIMSGMVSRADAIAASAAATQLVCLPDGQRLTIPAKLFEYVQLDTWLLAFAEPDSAMALALRDVDADVVAPGDVAAAERCIRARWEQFASGVRPIALGADGRFLRSVQAERLLSIFAALPKRDVTTSVALQADQSTV